MEAGEALGSSHLSNLGSFYFLKAMLGLSSTPTSDTVTRIPGCSVSTESSVLAIVAQAIVRVDLTPGGRGAAFSWGFEMLIGRIICTGCVDHEYDGSCNKNPHV